MSGKQDKTHTIVQETMIVKTHYGLHVRPASLVSKIVQESLSEVTLMYGERRADGRSPMQMVAMAVPENGFIHIHASGVDALETVQKIVQVFQ